MMVHNVIRAMKLTNILRRLIIVPAATALLFVWIIGIILSPVVWPVVWVLTGRNIFDTKSLPRLALWMEEQVERILPE